MDRMQELVNLLNSYAYNYYVLDEPTIADKQYDALYDELLALEKSENRVLFDSPSHRIGGEPIKSFTQHTHINKLYSLGKCNSFGELREWDDKIRKAAGGETLYTLEYKLDGLTLCLTYENGKLKIASTRGNGSVGEDVTSQVKTIKSIPPVIDYKGVVEAQGEGIMRWSAFNKYNENAAEPLKNPRNGVAGAIRNLDPKVTATRNLDIIFYNVNYLSDMQLNSQTESINFLKSNHFKTEKLFTSTNIEQLIAKIETIDRSKLDFLIDGMVIKVDDFALRSKLGYTDKFPRWAIAYKFEAEETTTTLLDVIWQVGRTGKLTPLAILEPVELCGATISKATLNNFSDILRKKVKIGSTVFLRRSNDVIPEILGIAEDNGGSALDMPEFCPSCGAKIIQDGAHIFCPNEYGCEPQICGRIEHFCTKACMNIDGVSDKTVLQLYRKLGINSITQLYDITEGDLSKIDGFKDKRISNFLTNVEKSKGADLPHFINALGIPNIGKKTAYDLSEHFGNISALMDASTDELKLIPEVGDIMADSIIAYFIKHKLVIERFFELGVNPIYAKTAASDNYFNGKNIVITGALSKPRQIISEILAQKGARIQESVTSETDILIAGEKAGSKLTKAQKLGKKIIDENEYIRLSNS